MLQEMLWDSGWVGLKCMQLISFVPGEYFAVQTPLDQGFCERSRVRFLESYKYYLYLLFVFIIICICICRLNQQDPMYSEYLCVMVSGQQSQSMTQRGKSRMESAPWIRRDAATMQHTTSYWLIQCYENQAPTTLEFCMTRVNRKENAIANDDPVSESVDRKGHV